MRKEEGKTAYDFHGKGWYSIYCTYIKETLGLIAESHVHFLIPVI